MTVTVLELVVLLPAFKLAVLTVTLLLFFELEDDSVAFPVVTVPNPPRT